jgi:DNA-binding MarR family transcriptional regulator
MKLKGGENVKTEERIQLSEEMARAIFKFRKFSLPERLLPEINLSEFRLLKVIKHFMKSAPDGIKVSELSKELQVTPARATHMINPLEEGGYIERFSHSRDRRLVLIKPTAKGTEITERVEEGVLKKFGELASFLGERDSRELIRLLGKTQDFFNERSNDGNNR